MRRSLLEDDVVRSIGSRIEEDVEEGWVEINSKLWS